MADSEHVAKLQEGVEAWNAWRKQKPDIRPNLHKADLSGANLNKADLTEAYLRGAILYEADLSRADLFRTNLVGAHLYGADLREAYLDGADLRVANLRGANLNKADLSGANLGRADLSRANLTEAYLPWANLSGANLTKAYLHQAILHRTNLREANLCWANLREAYLSEANLAKANLTEVELYETTFANVDLTNVKGLDTCVDHGPSRIDYRTLEQSGKLPQSFLRGCGLPDPFIDYLPSLLNQPIQHYSCFISYASKDEALAKRLHADLQDKGVRCWFAPEDIKIGDKFRVRIDEAIRTYEKLLLLLSENSMASAWVDKEVETAFDKEIEREDLVLFPIRLDDAVLESKTGWAADIRRSRHIGDFSNWKNHDDYQKGLERLLRDLKVEKE